MRYRCYWQLNHNCVNDLQVENLLLSSKGEIKLCDFGSATTERIQPDDSWSQSKRGLIEDEVSMTLINWYKVFIYICTSFNIRCSV